MYSLILTRTRTRIIWIFFSIILCVLLSQTVQAQEHTQFCGTPDDWSISQAKTVTMTPNNGGRYITADGTLKALVVFARFPDDTEENGHWPDEDGFPSFVNTIIDANASVGSTNFLNITNYH